MNPPNHQPIEPRAARQCRLGEEQIAAANGEIGERRADGGGDRLLVRHGLGADAPVGVTVTPPVTPGKPGVTPVTPVTPQKR